MACLTTGFVAGCATVGRDNATPEADAPAAIDTLRSNHHSSATALETAERWLAATDSKAKLTDSRHRRAALVTLVAPEARNRLGRQLGDAATAMADPMDSSQVARSARLGYRVLAYTPSRAVISAWEIVARSSSNLGPTALWARSRLTLVWRHGWRVRSTHVEAVPLIAWTAAQVANMDSTYRPLHNAR
jgi:hypothetical protein